MTIDYLSAEESKQWKKLLADYLNSADSLEMLYGRKPSLESFAGQMEEKAQQFQERERLVAELKRQYDQYHLLSKPKEKLIEKLGDKNSFTVTTGHQLCLFGGPGYFVYKILGCIALANRLKAAYPDKSFIPVFWLASEDHDFEEINHVQLFGNRISWEREAAGAVGALGLEGIDKSLEALKNLFGQSPHAEILGRKLEDSFVKAKNLSEAVFSFVNALFEDFELLCIDANSKELKSVFKPIIEDELFNESASKQASKANQILEAASYPLQIHIRDINLFYLQASYRERIVRSGDQWQTADGKISWSKQSLLKEVQNSPEHFSPNVALRPLYQEKILPNLAYIGGGGEIAYWLQLKPIFDYYKTSFPILMPRLSATAILPSISKKIEKLGLPVAAYFNRIEDLTAAYLANQTALDDFDEESNTLKQMEEALLAKMADLDEGFRKTVSSNIRGMEKILEGIQAKYRKQLKIREETSINQLNSIQAQLYPDGKLQERVENFSCWYLRSGPEGLKRIEAAMNPFDFNMLLLHL